jgi:hypothetical protein
MYYSLFFIQGLFDHVHH